MPKKIKKNYGTQFMHNTQMQELKLTGGVSDGWMLY